VGLQSASYASVPCLSFFNHDWEGVNSQYDGENIEEFGRFTVSLELPAWPPDNASSSGAARVESGKHQLNSSG